MQAMIFAAGKGTRLKPLTDILPKALVPVGGKPLIQIVLERLVNAGADRVVVNVHHHAEQMKNMLRLLSLAFPCDIIVSDESAELLETGGGIKKAAHLFRPDEPILIHNCDILLSPNVDLGEFYRQCRRNGSDATLLVSERKTQRYLLFNEDMRLVGWTNISTGEVKSPYEYVAAMNGKSNVDWNSLNIRLYAFSGIHCLSPRLFGLMDEWPERFPIMDFYLKHSADVCIMGGTKQGMELLDVGKLDTLANAESFISHHCYNDIV